MYASLDRIDLVTSEGTDESHVGVVLTDHRAAREIEAAPEVSVLFAMTRVIVGRRALEQQGKRVVRVRYAAAHEVPSFLIEALDAVGAELDVGGAVRAVGTAARSADAIADEAFTALAARVARRVGLRDPAAVLHALEAETSVAPPRKDDDEAAYWTRVLELMAVAIAVIRAGQPGVWAQTPRTEVPFGFVFGPGRTMLPSNRAQRFIERGAEESMFLLVTSVQEVARGNAGLPVLPTLRPRAAAIADGLVWRPIVDDEAAPVIAYGRDGENTFSLLLREREETSPEALHEEAMRNIAGVAVEIEEHRVGELAVLAIAGSWFACEKLVDAEFMRGLHARLGAETLVAGVPRRGVLVVADAEGAPRAPHAIAALVEAEHARDGTQSLCPIAMLVRDGVVVGALPLVDHEEEGDADRGD